MNNYKENFKTNLKRVIFLFIFWFFCIALTAVFAQTKQDLAYDVVWMQLKASMYMMDVENWEEIYNPEKDKANNIEVRNACLRLTGVDDMKVCKLNVCYQVGIPFNSCIAKWWNS